MGDVERCSGGEREMWRVGDVDVWCTGHTSPHARWWGKGVRLRPLHTRPAEVGEMLGRRAEMLEGEIGGEIGASSSPGQRRTSDVAWKQRTTPRGSSSGSTESWCS